MRHPITTPLILLLWLTAVLCGCGPTSDDTDEAADSAVTEAAVLAAPPAPDASPAEDREADEEEKKMTDEPEEESPMPLRWGPRLGGTTLQVGGRWTTTAFDGAHLTWLQTAVDDATDLRVELAVELDPASGLVRGHRLPLLPRAGHWDRFPLRDQRLIPDGRGAWLVASSTHLVALSVGSGHDPEILRDGSALPEGVWIVPELLGVDDGGQVVVFVEDRRVVQEGWRVVALDRADGSERTLIELSRRPAGLAVGGGQVFWQERDRFIERLSLEAGASSRSTVTQEGGDTEIRWFALAPEHLVWEVEDEMGQFFAIWSARRQGGEPERIFVGARLVGVSGEAAVIERHNKLWRLPLDEPSPTPTEIPGLAPPDDGQRAVVWEGGVGVIGRDDDGAGWSMRWASLR